MKRLEIHISYVCPNNCIFCSEKNRLLRFKNHEIDFNDLKLLLKEKRAAGFNHVNFTGGEPTLYGDFGNLLQFAKKIGYKIYIGSNGLTIADENKCSEWLPLIDEISLSLHGPDEQIHNLHTSNQESFSKIIKSFANINNYIDRSANKPYFFCNSVITHYNFDRISDLLKLLSGFKNLKQVLLSNVAPEGRAYGDYKKLAIPYHKFKLKIGEWVEIANRNKQIVRFFGLPLCVLGDYHVYSNDLNWDERTTYELGIEKNTIILKEKETVLDRKRGKIEECQVCDFNKICGGVFDRYLESCDSKEIKAFK